MKRTERWLKSMRHQRTMAEYIAIRRHMEELWSVLKSPLKFPAPARRRRSDREIPKAA